jgi:hypothetical protein
MMPDTPATSVILPEAMAQLRAAAALAASGVRDAEAMRQACERMDRLREENRRKVGNSPIGADIIREARDAR